MKVSRTGIAARLASLALPLLCVSACDRTTFSTSPKLSGGADYSYGTVVSFGRGGAGDAFKISGWSHAEEEHTWTEGNSAAIAVKITATDAPITFVVTALGYTHPPELPVQPVEVFANDQKIADWQIDKFAQFTAPVPPERTRR
jgi:hypothetical protein